MTTSDEPPTVFILYGGTGDLARRLVLPALFELYDHGLLPNRWKLVGNGRGDVAHEDFRAHVHDSLHEFGTAPEGEAWEEFAANISFAGGGFNSDDPGSLLDAVEEARASLGEDPRLVHYLAIPPSAFETITRGVAAHGLAEGSRIVYEKPYGTSPEGFRELDDLVHSVFDEEQVYRIDHFLGKEATQNLHLTRFANRLFGDVWHRFHVAEVQIDVPETLDIADRAKFYDATGAALDMLVTHLFQVAAEVAMEPPLSMEAGDLQTARESVLAAFRPLDPGDTVLGQYESYRATEGIADDSQTETFVATKLWVDTERWRDVPFLLRTGKKMAAGTQQVSLIFRAAEGPLHRVNPEANALVFDLEGSGALHIRLVTKQPGPQLFPAESTAVLDLAAGHPEKPLSAYSALLHDVLAGDRSLFTSSAGLAEAWRAFGPLLGPDRPAVVPYADDSWGPEEAAALPGPGGWLAGDQTTG